MKIIKKIFVVFAAVAVFVAAALLIVNFAVKSFSKASVFTLEENSATADCILILGCGVRADGTPSNMLEDRLKAGISLYKSGAAPKIIMSGDHGRESYDEVNLMKSYAVLQGVPSSDIFMDHAGFSTYESMYRARDIFMAESVIVVTQKYHLYRAIYDGKKLGLSVTGVCADLRTYRGDFYRETREVLARNKDFFYCLFTPKPTYLGEAIPVSGNGDITNDK